MQFVFYLSVSWFCCSHLYIMLCVVILSVIQHVSFVLAVCDSQITSLCVPVPQAIYVPADDLTDPAPATTFAHLDATTVLSRGIAELGIYPAVDPLDSTSRILDPNIVGEEHYRTARAVQKILQVRPSPWGLQQH